MKKENIKLSNIAYYFDMSPAELKRRLETLNYPFISSVYKKTVDLVNKKNEILNNIEYLPKDLDNFNYEEIDDIYELIPKEKRKDKRL